MSDPICLFASCARVATRTGLCDTHYAQKRRGVPLTEIKHHLPWPDRFWAKVDKTAECWLWLGAIQGDGYGSAWRDGAGWLAHRAAYEMTVGPIPDGLVLDHLCRVRHCVNPAHLEPVTNWMNVMRGVGASAQNLVKTHCKHGHEFTPENTKILTTGQRACLTCRREGDHARYLARRRAGDQARGA